MSSDLEWNLILVLVLFLRLALWMLVVRGVINQLWLAKTDRPSGLRGKLDSNWPSEVQR